MFSDRIGEFTMIRSSAISICFVVIILQSSPIGAAEPQLLKAPFTKDEAKRSQEAWAKFIGDNVEKEIDIGGGIKIQFELIPPGIFHMGSKDEELQLSGPERSFDNETPRHEVTITKPFYLGKYALTQREYMQLTGKTNPSWYSSTGGGKQTVADLDTSRYPVEHVSWEDAVDCASKLERKAESRLLRVCLPSEAMWEYACRAGTETPWNVGNVLQSDDANFDQQGGGKLNRTRTVGLGVANAFGLYDMHGNVSQWCSDWYGKYGSYAQSDPKGPETGSSRVNRGGCWSASAGGCRSAFRGGDAPWYCNG